MIRSTLTSLALTAALAVPAAAQANYLTFSDDGTTGCGPTLTGSYETISNGNGLRVNLTVTTEQARAVVLLFLSNASTIPGIPIDDFFGQSHGCLLFVNPVFSQAHQAMAGSYTWSKSVGAWWGTAYVQFAELFMDTPSLEVKLTNMLAVTRPRT